MINTKKAMLRTILLSMIVISAFFIAVDFMRYYQVGSFYKAIPSDLIKRLNVILAASLTWLAGKQRLQGRDIRHMRLVFAIICIAEGAFLTNNLLLGIGCFAVCQSLLIKRHSYGFRQKYRYAGAVQRAKLIWAAAFLICMWVVATAISLPFRNTHNLYFAAIAYGMLLSASMWFGYANYVLGIFPKKNSRLIAAGTACFFVGDTLVGLCELMSYSLVWVAASSIIWMIYIPALTLLALSCYKYDAKSNIIPTLTLIRTRSYSGLKVKALK